MSRRQRHKQRDGANGRTRTQRTRRSGGRVETVEFESGLRITRAGTGVHVDGTHIPPDTQEALRDAFGQFATEIPRLLGLARADLISRLATVPTLPVLEFLASRIYFVNPDTYREWEVTRTSNEVEWVTRAALSLAGPINEVSEETARELEEFDSKLTETFDLLNHQSAASHFIRHGADAGPFDWLAARSKSHLTAVRFPEYEFQRLRITRDLFAPFEDDLRTTAGFTSYEAISAAQAITAIRTDRYRQRREQAYALGRQARSSGASALVVSTALGSALFMSSAEDSTFTPDDLEGVLENPKAFLDFFSLPFGQSSPPEVGAVLDILDRPIVNLGNERYFCHLSALIDSAFQRRFEEVMALERSLWNRYESHRQRYCEDRSRELLQVAMPAAQFEQNATYAGGEIDILVRMDRMLFFVECKAGRLKFPQRRGARLRRALGDILTHAHDQLIRASQALDQGVEFLAADGTPLAISRSEFDRIYLVHVTLDDTSSFTTNAAQVVAAGLYRGGPQPWSVNLTDLELMADIVDCNSHLPHYLDRRGRITASTRFQAPEEMDWFMHYIQRGLYFDENLDELTSIHLMSFTEKLDNYYLHIQGARSKSAPKPEVSMQPNFRKLLLQVEASGVVGWSIGGDLLMDTSGADRALILEQLRHVRRRKAPSVRSLIFKDRLLILLGAPVGFGRLRTFARWYAEARIGQAGAQSGLVVAVSQTLPATDPEFLYIDFVRESAPDVEEVARRLASFVTHSASPENLS